MSTCIDVTCLFLILSGSLMICYYMYYAYCLCMYVQIYPLVYSYPLILVMVPIQLGKTPLNFLKMGIFANVLANDFNSIKVKNKTRYIHIIT